jgi:D-lyxose ketol-isomerase
MKQSEINSLIDDARSCFVAHGWALPPEPKWDVTDFSLGDWRKHGLLLLNLTEQAEYCEKLMYSKRGMVCPCHCHAKKKEDIIVRWGELTLRTWRGRPESHDGGAFELLVNGKLRGTRGGDQLVLQAGERVTLTPGTYHEFWASSDECIIGEVSTANDDDHDNFFVNPQIGRYGSVEAD